MIFHISQILIASQCATWVPVINTCTVYAIRELPDTDDDEGEANKYIYAWG